MMYVTKRDAHHVRNLDNCSSIAASGSVVGMRNIYGWPKGGQVRIGAYIYNVGTDEVARLRAAGVLRGVR